MDSRPLERVTVDNVRVVVHTYAHSLSRRRGTFRPQCHRLLHDWTPATAGVVLRSQREGFRARFGPLTWVLWRSSTLAPDRQDRNDNGTVYNMYFLQLVIGSDRVEATSIKRLRLVPTRLPLDGARMAMWALSWGWG